MIKEAKVNIAAIAYHFGDKEDLFRAVIERFAEPVVAAQLQQLERVKDKRNLEHVLRAFYVPPLELVKAKGTEGEILALFLGRMQTEPEPIFSIVDEQFADCRDRFIEAFRVCLPKATPRELHWKFEFMLSLILCFLTRQNQIRKRYNDHKDWTVTGAATDMINFCLNGM